MSFAPSAPSRLAQRLVAGRRFVVLAMLLALQAAMVAEPGGAFQRLWLLVHFGFFLLWQPFFAAERELKVFSVVMLLAVTVAILYFVSGWMIVTWLLLLLGILGGRVFTAQAALRSRFYLVAFAYVLALLLLWTVPTLLMGHEQVPDIVSRFVRHALPFVLALLLVLPFQPGEDAGQVFDFFYAVLVFQLGVVLVLGTLVMMRFTGDDYADSVMLTVLGSAAALFVFAVLWNPMRGFGGLRTYFSTYLMSVGMPFELWMRRIAELAETEAQPQRFLEQALEEVARLPWMRGGRWRSPDGEGRFGEESAHTTRFAYHDLEVVFHTEVRMSPALFLHMRLLAQVVGEFYEGKRRENALRQHAYLQAVHESGARLTHDVKNILQSIYALTAAAPPEGAGGRAPLMQRQLPQLAKRLHATLEKLRSPEIAARDFPVRAGAWWAEVERRLAGGDVALEASITAEGNVPSALFDSFVENTIENARAKRAREPQVAIALRFLYGPDEVELRVTDTGTELPEAVARHLFREPIERDAGMGIGLYHVARLAIRSGFAIELRANRAGEVSFALRPQAEARASAAGQG